MKISSSARPALDGLARVQSARPAADPRAASAFSAGAGGRLSTVGSVVSDLRAQAAAHGVQGDVRPDVVADMKREIAAGRLGSPADVERAIDALLQGF